MLLNIIYWNDIYHTRQWFEHRICLQPPRLIIALLYWRPRWLLQQCFRSSLLIYIHKGRSIRNYLAAIYFSFHYCQRFISSAETLSSNYSDTMYVKQFYLSLYISLRLFPAKCTPLLHWEIVRLHLPLSFLSVSSLTKQLWMIQTPFHFSVDSVFRLIL